MASVEIPVPRESLETEQIGHIFNLNGEQGQRNAGFVTEGTNLPRSDWREVAELPRHKRNLKWS